MKYLDMKDLTHYFVSPQLKSSEDNVESGNEIGDNLNNITITEGENNNANNDNNNKKAEVTEEKKKRSRVKIRICLKDTEKNNSCDIIENKNDVVDKTPSPFRNKNSTSTKQHKNDKKADVSPMRQEDRLTQDETTIQTTTAPNAFQVLMTRNKSFVIQKEDAGSTPNPASTVSNKRIDHIKVKSKLKERLENHDGDQTDRKSYSKRKHAETEEADCIDDRLEKPVKLLRRDDGTNSKSKNNPKDENKKEIEGKRKDPGTKPRRRRSKKISQSENSTPVRMTEESPKNKIKWTMRVKLQSHSDDENHDDGEINEITQDHAMTSEDEYIFTPKNKVKHRKKRVRKNDSEREGKHPEGDIEKQEIPETVDITKFSSSKSAKHRTSKKNAKTLDLNVKTESHKLSDTNIEERIPNCSVEILDDNNLTVVDEPPIVLFTKKLAPLFVRKAKPNPAVIEAKKSFLKSGIPETVRKMILEQKTSCNDSGTSTMPFPIISHVLQSENESNSEMETSSSFESLYKQKSHLNQPVFNTSDLNASRFKSLLNFGSEVLLKSKKTKEEKFPRIARENFETVIREIESRCSDTRIIWESVVTAGSNRAPKKSTAKRNSKKLKLHRKSDALESSKDNPDNLNPTWLCKYKPMTSIEVVGNELAIAKLRNWLNGWRLPSVKDDQSSGDDFYPSDCSSSGYYENNEVAVLIGPHGSGKTASVYAIAEELGYRVLEVNASSRRTGKKILSNFQEATKSHRVKRDQGLLPMTKKKPSEKKVPQNSLILIEDIDLIFEVDEGFVSATFQLAANTRRPIVMTCKETSPHLSKMAPQQQFIHFVKATGNRVSALLELIALAESGYRLSQSLLDILLRNGDLRQSLLQLQYILLSGPPSSSQLGTIPDSTLWPDMHPLIYKPAIKLSKRNRKGLDEKEDAKIIVEKDAELVEMLAKKLDNVMLISSLTEVENPASPPWGRKLSPSLSLAEDFAPYSNCVDLGIEIASWLRIASLGSDETVLASRETNYNSKSQLGIKRKVKIGVDLALSHAVPSTLEHRSKSTDYLPILRSMCRSEQDRASINTKRGNRFHNYLHGLNLASASSNILSAASSVFKDNKSTVSRND